MILLFGSHSECYIKSIDIHKTQPKRFLLLVHIKGLKSLISKQMQLHWDTMLDLSFSLTLTWLCSTWHVSTIPRRLFQPDPRVPWYNGYLSELVARQRVRSKSNGFNMNKTLKREHEFLPSLMWGAMMAWETGETRWGRLSMKISE